MQARWRPRTARPRASWPKAGAAEVRPGFRPFLAWLSELLADDLRLITGEGREMVRLARRVARLSASDLALELLFGRDSVGAEVRGLIYDGRTEALQGLRVGDAVTLQREPDNPYDPNAIRVRRDDGRDLGYVARETARGIAGRLDDDPSVGARVTEVDALHPSLRLLLTLR